MKIFVDQHHDGLLESLYLLFEDRLGHELYRPVGMEWFTNGLWQINDSEETARQYLMPDFLPPYDYPPLNNDLIDKGDYYQINWYGRLQRLVTLEQFRAMSFDIVIASLPQHIEPFKKLATEKGAKFILQVGNNWDFDQFGDINVMASIAPKETATNAIFYHQNFDTAIFYPSHELRGKNIYSFMNTLRSYQRDIGRYEYLKEIMPDWNLKMYGGQNDDGNINGNDNLANKMREAMFGFHSKTGSDGFGHVIHSLFATGTVPIVNYNEYQNCLAGELMIPGETCLVIPEDSNMEKVKVEVESITDERWIEMSHRCAEIFREKVDYEREEIQIADFLSNLR